MDLLQAPSLGQFDVVLCLAVPTEVTDLIRSLLILKEIAKELLYIILALAKRFYLPSFRKGFWRGILKISPGYCELRKTKIGWPVAPDLALLYTVMGDKFTKRSVIPSVRYDLVTLTRSVK